MTRGVKMRTELRTAFELELQQARAYERQRDHARAWRGLERAHVLSQPFAAAHVLVHARMLAFAWRRRDAHELLGQLARLMLAAPGSLLGRAPLGNTGGANVGMFRPMPIPEDLRRLLEG